MTIARKYRRVSTDEQANSGFSLDAQTAKLADFCDRRGYTPAGDYVDDGYSAKTLQRPAIQRLLREAKPGDIIVVYKLDRLTRSAKDLEYLLELSEKREIYFQSATEDIETATPAGRLFVRMLVQFAQFERETIAERSSMGRKQQARSGRFSGSVAPFGYRLVDSDEVKRGRVMKRLERDPLTAHIVPMIYERYLGGYGARAIAVWLNDELNVRTVEGKRFSSIAVSFILRNPAYVGESVVRKRKKAVVERYEATHEPLIEKEMFNAVQRLFDVRAKLPPRVATGLFPLAGIAFCGVCGGKLAGSNERMVINGKRTDKRYRVYRCSNRISGKGCGAKPFSSVSAEILEAAFRNELKAIVYTTDASEAFMRSCLDGQAHESDVLGAELERLGNELEASHVAVAQWDAKYERKRITEEEHEEKVAPHRERMREIRARISELETKLASVVSSDTIEEAIFSVARAWDEMDAPARKALVQSFVAAIPVRIVAYPKRRVAILPLSAPFVGLSETKERPNEESP